MGRDDRPLDVLWDDGERLYRRIWRDVDDGGRREFLVAQPCAEHPTPSTVSRLAHEYGLKDHLDHSWALRPLELVRERGQAMLLLEPTRARPLDEMIGAGLPVARFLRLAVAVTNAVASMHQCGLVHKDIKASNILIDAERGHARRRWKRARSAAILSSAAVAVAAVCAATLLVTAGHARLPTLMRDAVSRADSLHQYVTGCTLLVNAVAALGVLWVRRRSVLDLWLMVVLCDYLIEISLILIPSVDRYTLGWYAGRIFGLISASLVLFVLLYEITPSTRGYDCSMRSSSSVSWNGPPN
jgi:serine/threonine protein kinase